MQTESVYGILSLLPCLLGILLLASEAAGRNSQSQLRQEARLRGISDFRNDQARRTSTNLAHSRVVGKRCSVSMATRFMP